jgi:holo-[acyl-carrier protein] synthase
MIYGIGVDLVDIKRMEKVMNRWGERFVSKVFTADEAKTCYARAFPPSSFALRFAAKEAFSKALGLGMKSGVHWRDIEVFHYQGGRPGLKLHGRSEELCRQNNILRSHLSLSDEGNYGLAMVILEKP